MIDVDLDGRNEIVVTPNVEMDEPYDTKRIAAFVIESAQGDGERAGRRLKNWDALVGGDYPTKVDGYYPPNGPYSPATVDFVGDAHPEIVFDGKDGFIYCVSWDAKRLWRYDYASSHKDAAPVRARRGSCGIR